MKAKLYRLVSIVSVIVFAISVLVSGTYAWQSVNQMSKNEMVGLADFHGAELHKYKKLPDGTPTHIPVPDAKFTLYKINEQNPEQRDRSNQIMIIDGAYEVATDEYGVIRTAPLQNGEYVFVETEPAPDHKFDTDENNADITEYPFTVESGNIVVGGVIKSFVEVYNKAELSSLTIQKTVQMADGSELTDAQVQADFEFRVTFDDYSTTTPTPYKYSIDGVEQTDPITSGGTIHLKHGQTAVFSGLPVGMHYSVTETPKVNYRLDAAQSTNTSGTILRDGSVATFVNLYDPSDLPSGNLVVSKEVRGNGADTNKEFEFTAKIGTDAPFTFRLKHGEKIAIGQNLPAGTEFEITETDYSAEGYVSNTRTYKGTITGDKQLELPFVNVFNPSDNPGSLQIEKEVVADEGATPDPNKEFVFEITLSDNGTTQTYPLKIDGVPQADITNGSTIRLKAGQIALIENLPNGTTYTVKETDAGGYLPTLDTISGVIISDQTANITFQNKVHEEKGSGKIAVTKVLTGATTIGDADTVFNFKLTVDGVETEFGLKAGDTWTSPEFTAGTDYKVEEINVPDRYKQVSSVGDTGTIVNGETIPVTIVNTVVEREKVSIEGQKSWNLVGYDQSVMPESIKVRLVYVGADGSRSYLEELVVSAADNWHYVFGDRPKEDIDGNTIQYAIEEVVPDRFIATYDGYNITNTYVPPVSIDPPIIEKVVEGDEGAPNATFQFVLKGSLNAPMPEGSDEKNLKTLTRDGAGTLEIGRITFDRAGTYTYTISEMDSGEQNWTYDKTVYTLTVNVVERNGQLVATQTLTKSAGGVSTGSPQPVEGDKATFVNTYTSTPTTEKIVIAGTKTWRHGNNTNFPESIIVRVYADGELYAQRMVTSSDNWAYSFELPKYNEDGKEAKYTLGEEHVTNYRTEVNGYNITNTYDPTSENNTPNDGGNGYTSGGNEGSSSSSGGSSGGSRSYYDDDVREGTPKTGDSITLILWFVVMILSSAMFVMMSLARRKQLRVSNTVGSMGANAGANGAGGVRNAGRNTGSPRSNMKRNSHSSRTQSGIRISGMRSIMNRRNRRIR